MFKYKTALGVGLILKAFGILAINCLFTPGWFYWLCFLLVILHPYFAITFIGILFSVWKFKFWYWMFPSLFLGILSTWPEQYIHTPPSLSDIS